MFYGQGSKKALSYQLERISKLSQIHHVNHPESIKSYLSLSIPFTIQQNTKLNRVTLILAKILNLVEKLISHWANAMQAWVSNSQKCQHNQHVITYIVNVLVR